MRTFSRALSLTARLVRTKKTSRPAPGAPVAAHNVRRRCLKAFNLASEG